MSITPGTPDDLIEFWKPYDVPPSQMPTDEPQEPQAATNDLPAAFSPWSRGFTYGDWPDLRDAVWEGDDSDD